ncbi:MAG: nickel pincer cofactor biosynthesis protein LarC [Thermomicrobiales bacterium]
MARIAFFDPFSGASGNMILGALVDAGLKLPDLSAELTKIDLGGYSFRHESANHHGLTGTFLDVEVTDAQPPRTWSEIRMLIESSRLAGPVKRQALAIFGRLAEAEAKVHGTSVDQVHFHEVGAVDAIVDICGTCVGLALLAIDQVFSGPPRLGSGFARSEHGLIPVPGPATAELLASARAPVAGGDPGGEPYSAELLTPTGAAILTTLASFNRPDFVPRAIGYGFGSMQLPWPNALRVWIGETRGAPEPATELLLETNIDDMDPQHFALLMERMDAAGALDVWLTPIIMKKGRPATLVSAIVPASSRDAVESTMIENSTTLGVRATPIDRTKAARQFASVTTRWGEVRVKLRGWHGRIIDVSPEYDDCLAIARANDVPLREVSDDARRIAESFVGLRLTTEGIAPART